MGAGAKRKKRGLGGARCNRVTVSLDNDNYRKLKSLSISLDLSISEVIDMICDDAMQSEKYIDAIQSKYNKNPQYRVIPVRENSRLTW